MVERYIHYLSVGIANVINCFYPEVVALSGGIANQGEALLAPLREAVAPQVYGCLLYTSCIRMRYLVSFRPPIQPE